MSDKRLIRWLSLVLVLSLALVACGGNNTEEPEAGNNTNVGVEEPVDEEPVDEEPVDEEPVDEEPVDEPSGATYDLQLMGWSSSEGENTRLQEVVDAFNASRDDINVTLNLVPDYDTRLQTSLAGGAPPDVFYIDSFRLPDLVEAGAVEPAEGRIEDPDDFYESLRAAFTYDGTFYCPPKDFSTLGLQYNIDMFDAAGLDYPNEDWTWDDLEAAAAELSDPDAGVYGLVLSADMALIAFYRRRQRNQRGLHRNDPVERRGDSGDRVLRRPHRAGIFINHRNWTVAGPAKRSAGAVRRWRRR